MSRVKELHRGVGDIALECLCSGGEEERVTFSPNRQERRLILSEILLKLWIKRDVIGVVLEKVQLKFIRAGTREIKVIQRAAVWRNQAGVRNAVRVLESRRFRLKKRP